MCLCLSHRRLGSQTPISLTCSVLQATEIGSRFRLEKVRGPRFSQAENSFVDQRESPDRADFERIRRARAHALRAGQSRQ
jgi:hypothetical protein